MAEHEKINIAVIIPAYNEEITIRDVILEYHKELPEAYIYVVDNNSKDKTNAIANSTLKQQGIKGGVIIESRQGKAFAVRKAFSSVWADKYIMVDADMTYPASDIKLHLEIFDKENADLLVGDRLSAGVYAKENKRNFHSFGNNLVKSIVNFLYKSKLHDVMSGYRIFSRQFVTNYPILSNSFEVETEMTLHALDKKWKIVEVPIDYKDRPAGSISKLNTFKDGINVIKTIFRIFKDYKPLYFFGILSLLVFLLGLCLGTPVIIEFIKTHYIRRVPTAILASGLVIVSFILFTAGLILDTIVRFHRFDYELKKIQYWEKNEKF